MFDNFFRAATRIADIGATLYNRGLVPATAGNFSIRLHDGTLAITASGVDKGFLKQTDILHLKPDGSPLTPLPATVKCSAETLLHTRLYADNPEIGCVLHTHSRPAVVLSRFLRRRGQDTLILNDHELLKAFAGITHHETPVALPLLDNSQDMELLSTEASARLAALDTPAIGYLIAGHGLYTWGADARAAFIAVEAIEFLLQTELETRLLEGHS
ncbi:MAG: methylthioribulose 1-phosphate dehydratase [Holosporales bacterium]|jgi:methylthioribulose-1-phosphate dehydratase